MKKLDLESMVLFFSPAKIFQDKKTTWKRFSFHQTAKQKMLFSGANDASASRKHLFLWLNNGYY